MPRLRLINTPSDPDARERKARALRKRFERVSHRIERPARRRRLLLRLSRIAIPVFLVLAGYLWMSVLSPWPPWQTLRHIAAMPGCAYARSVDVAPADRGEPGYWPWLDADNDGIACEAFPSG
ncbi:excalibur calcium-binding domain-containing protein [uncultured Rhodospira sp.]|uniref:excalibur calcium-binding domain-containing protein n=1 Tax=uncultured Rhodospira sp. TaxID=1936189 RepID=UPI00263486F6|nr:excalibur calcium-binding domain-containing protein [uncultured Rhodospira sp.]